MGIRRNAARGGVARGDVAKVVEQDGSGDLARLVVDEITWYMREHKVSRAELAQAMKVSPGRVSQILSGEENLTLRTVSGVFTALGAQVDFALRPADEPVDLLGDVADDTAGPVRAAAAAL
jgi:transcriptional regulator with XRE-family HTH domain